MSRKLFTENAYSVLGLSADASEKEILKRSREIENWLKIDEVPDYECDFPFSKESRTETKVKKATEKLMSPEKRVIEMFFWVYEKDATSKKAIKLFREGEELEGLKILEAKAKEAPTNFMIWRNKAVLESLMFGEKTQKKYLKSSIKSWKKIFDSDKMLKDFKKLFLLADPMVDQKSLEDFSKQAQKTLAGFYESVSSHEDNPEIFTTFNETFEVQSDDFDRKILDPLLTQLAEVTQEIEKYDGDFDSAYEYYRGRGTMMGKWISQEGATKVREFMKKSDELTDKLFELGDNVWDSSKVRMVRSDNAEALRILDNRLFKAVAKSLINHREDLELIQELSDLVLQIAPVDSMVWEDEQRDNKSLLELSNILKKNGAIYGSRHKNERRAARRALYESENNSDDKIDYEDEFYTGDVSESGWDGSKSSSTSSVHKTQMKATSKPSDGLGFWEIFWIVFIIISTIVLFINGNGAVKGIIGFIVFVLLVLWFCLH